MDTTTTTTNTATTHHSSSTRCGVGPCRPSCLQPLANKNVYTLVFAFTQVIQLAYLTYFQSAISTLEKEFGAQTQTIAIVMSGNEVSQILCGLGLVYIAARGNRPRWLAFSMLIVAASNVVLASPALLLHSHRAPPADAQVAADNVCGATPTVIKRLEPNLEPQSSAAMSAALAIVFVGQFIAGTGFTMINTLSLSYLDDNINKSVSPLYIGIATGLRLMGPVVGSFLASFCLSIYVSLVEPTAISHKDPRWVGAWWLGFLVLAASYVLGAMMVVLFPRSLPRKSVDTLDQPGEQPQQELALKPDKPKGNVKDFKATMKRLLTNKVLLCHAMSRCFHLFGTNGYSAFMPKYLESNFRQTASGASFLAGVSGSLMRMVGILATGLVLRKWKPRTSWVTGWNLVLDVVYIGALAALMVLSCPNGSEMVGFDANAKAVDSGSGGGQLGACGGRCDCSQQSFNPVCLDGRNYFSPCHAGCRTTYRIDGTKEQMYGNCTCAIDDPAMSNATYQLENSTQSSNDWSWTAVAGYCSQTCSQFQAYLLTVGATKLVMATRKVGRLLITLRCVEEKDKSVALALYAVMESLFAYIPCAVIYGALLDKACILWAGSEGQGGHCWIYDSNFLRYAMHGITMAAFVGGTLLDAVVLYQCRKMALFGDEDPKTDSNINNNNNNYKKEDESESSPKGQNHQEHMAEAVSRISID